MTRRPAAAGLPARRRCLRHLGALAAGLHPLLAAGLPALLASAAAQAQAGPTVQVVAHGLVNPWGLAFLPDGRMLVTERPGRLRIVGSDGRLSAPLAGLPPVAAEGQGGLLDVVTDPQHAVNRRIWFSFSEPDERPRSGANGTAVARARLDGPPGAERLAEVQVLWRQVPKVDSSLHFGSRLVFGRDGRLFITTGERFSQKDQAQTLDNTLGKIVRIEPDGGIPPDNPFVGQAGARPEIWSYGHRNIQGAAIHPVTGALWATEHGPQGGDELNLVQRGGNHGWPVITFGRNYVTGTRIGEGTARADVVAPVTTWLPTSIAPSGMAFLTSERYEGRHPGWQGQLFIGALRGQALIRLQLSPDGKAVLQQERLLQTLNERIRDVRQGPDGLLYLLTDNPDGRVLRLLP